MSSWTQANNDSYDNIDTCGTHSTSFEKKDRGIHSLWTQRVDALIECGILPGKALNRLQKEATEITRLLLELKPQFRKDGAEHVVDCYIHVDMMKNRVRLNDAAYIETARHHVGKLSRMNH